MPRRILSWLVPLLALVVLAPACSSEDTPRAADRPSATPTTAAPPPAPPHPGSCHALTFTTATQPANAAPAVPCKRRHTAVTMFVGNVDTVRDGHLLAVDSDLVARQVDQVCPRKLAGFVGGDEESRRLSRFHSVWFAPTLEQADDGAIWYRCDLVALAGNDRLLPLPRQVRGVLDEPGALDQYGTCGTSAPQDKDFARVACARTHSWRAVATVDLPATAGYLAKPASAEANDRCRDVAAARAQDPLKYRWSFEWPGRADWQAGQRWGLCWVPTQ